MDTLSNEMKTFDLSLVINNFELECPFEKELVGIPELPMKDPALVNNADTDDQFAVMSIVVLWKNSVEEAGS